MSKADILQFFNNQYLCIFNTSSGEREKRKDQLLDLQKSKQERTDSELQNLRQVCTFSWSFPK